VAGTGVTANAVCPTYVRTPMTERTLDRITETTDRSREEALAGLEASTGLGRLLEPQEVADAVWYLASNAAAAVNGHALVLDGGGG
jgi:NAD(P)-dependent dehydrogenase (short-subunit alcohol dehydrogenase family)